MGFVKANIKCCHLIRKENMKKRVLFCKKMLDDSEQFMDVCSSDECTFQVDSNSRTCLVTKDDSFGRLRPGAKHPPKIHLKNSLI
uniref:Apple domain-containing protein n=1 Tax=Heterorhabditis bacteriophora TaxID=37862 RepID=A0A1I7WA16_HETBA